LTNQGGVNPEVWAGAGVSLATLETWNLRVDFQPWTVIQNTCVRFGSWRLTSTSNPGDALFGSGAEYFTGEIFLGVTGGEGRFAGVAEATSQTYRLVPLQQLGGPCWNAGWPLTLALNSLFPVGGPVPYQGPALVAGLALSALAPASPVFATTPLALGSFQFTVVVP
jgi:hypothetical protein